MQANAYPALVLNADFRPLSYFPLSLASWRDAVGHIVTGRVSVVAEYDAVVRSPTVKVRLPSVIALRQYRHHARRVAFTRFNVFLRDRFTCQYCGRVLPAEALTFDHVLPRANGGVTSWANVVTACGPCNLRKGDRTAMQPKRPPLRPSPRELLAARRAFPPNHLHASWIDYLYWDVELEA